MRRQNEGRLSERLILTGILGCVVLAGIPLRRVEAATISWPALNPKAPCGNFLGGLGLNDCIDQVAQPGDVVQVRTNNPIQEDVTIGKSLTLQASPGFAPILGPLHYIFLSNVGTDFSTVVVEDFTLQQGRIFAVQASLSDFHVTLRNLTIQNTFNDGPEIQIRTGQPGPFAPVFFDISNNHLTVPVGQYLGAEAISVEGGNAQRMTGVIRNNRIDHFHGGQQGAIGLYNLAANPFDVDVIANEIRGSNYNYGVNFFQFGGGSGVLRYLDNLVVGQVNVAGAPGAYVINVSDGNAAFEIVNNTAADGGIGILINGRDDLGASWSGIVANNIVANMSGGGIQVGQPTQTSGIVDNDHNLVHSVAFNDFIAGPGTVFADPLFGGGANYRLTDPSPARDAGNVARVPTDLTTDLDGQPRQIAAVDLGAYESPAIPIPCDTSAVHVPGWPMCGLQLDSTSFAVAFEPDGAGGIYFVSPRLAEPGLSLQHVTGTGAVAAGWPADGVPISDSGNSFGSVVVLDGNGGVFVVFRDEASGGAPSIQHITANGSVAPGWPDGGMALPGAPPVSGGVMTAVSNGSGGIIVCCQDYTGPNPATMQSLTASGAVAPGWPANGLQLPMRGVIASDGAGGAFVAERPGSTPLDIVRVMRVTAAGATAPGWPANGFACKPSTGAQIHLTYVVPDLSGGVLVAWADISGSQDVVRAQRVLASPQLAPGWPTSGLVLGAATRINSFPRPKSDGAAGLLATWSVGNLDLDAYVVVQSARANGLVAAGWAPNGTRVSTAASANEDFPDVTSDGAGGAFVTWYGDGSVRATRLTSTGAVSPGWSSTGIELDPTGHGGTTCIGDGCGSAIAFWRRPFGAPENLSTRALRLDASGPPDGECFVASSPLGPGAEPLGPVTVTFDTQHNGWLYLGTGSAGPPAPAGLQLVPAAPPLYYELTLTPHFSKEVEVCIQYDPASVVGSEDNLVLLHFDETAQPPAWVDVTTSRNPATNTICGLSTLSPFVIAESNPTDIESIPKPVFALRQNMPNPFNPTTTIEFAMSERGWVRLGVFDVGGRLVRTLVEGERDAGVHRVLWRGNDSDDKRCSSGVYFYRIETAQGMLTRRMVLVR